jgi:chromosome segregation ATPase
MNEATMHVNGDTANGFHDEANDDGPLATERAEARIRVEGARSDHAEKLTELNRLAGAIRSKESAIERQRAELANLATQHATQQVRTEAARKRLEGAEDELATISKDKVRAPRGPGKKGARS